MRLLVRLISVRNDVDFFSGAGSKAGNGFINALVVLWTGLSDRFDGKPLRGMAVLKETQASCVSRKSKSWQKRKSGS